MYEFFNLLYEYDSIEYVYNCRSTCAYQNVNHKEVST